MGQHSTTGQSQSIKLGVVPRAPRMYLSILPIHHGSSAHEPVGEECIGARLANAEFNGSFHHQRLVTPHGWVGFKIGS